MSEYKGQRAKAAMVVNACKGGEVVTTDTMRLAFDLDEQQVQYVKREARKIAAKWGWLWSYDPEVNGYRIAPEGDEETYKRMTAYSYRLSASALTSTVLVVNGAYAGGFSDKRMTGLRIRKLRAMMETLNDTADEIEES